MPNKLYDKYIQLKDKNYGFTRTIQTSKTPQRRPRQSEQKDIRARKKNKKTRATKK